MIGHWNERQKSEGDDDRTRSLNITEISTAMERKHELGRRKYDCTSTKMQIERLHPLGY